MWEGSKTLLLGDWRSHPHQHAHQHKKLHSSHIPNRYQSLPLILGPPRTICASSAATGTSAPASTTAVQPAGLF